MKNFILLSFIHFFFLPLITAQQSNKIDNCTEGITLNANYSKAAALQAIMDKYTAKDLPGLSMAVYTEAEGWWAGASGFAKKETKTSMNICHLQYLQSVSKTYMAVLIMKLHEEGKIKFDEPITRYLPVKYSRSIKNANKITVRMLLNHTSGIAEYINDPEYTGATMLNPYTVLKIDDFVASLSDEEEQFPPGSQYRYTNTNYMLLALIGDAITGNHATYMRQKMFQPLQLNNSFYRSDKGYLKYPALTDSYWDLLNVGRPANISPLQKSNVASMIGDDGIVSTPIDAVKFFKGLMEGKLVKDSSLAVMKQWVNRDNGTPAYGMGLIYFDIEGIVAYGHGGGGIGAGCLLLYIPVNKLYVFLALNSGTVFDGLTSQKADAMRNEILKALLM